MRGLAVAGAALAALVTASPPARATCEAEAADLRVHLRAERDSAFWWNTGWAIAFGVAAAGQLTVALLELTPGGEFDRDNADTLYVGAAKATIGLASRLVLPLTIPVPVKLDDPCRDLASLRDALTLAGTRERRSFWLTHLGGTALNLAGAILLGYRRSFEIGALSFAIGYPVGLANAYTQPRRSWKKWRREQATWSVGAVGVRSDGTDWTAWVGGRW